MVSNKQSENRLINRLAIMMCQLELIWKDAEESEWDESFEEKFKKQQEEIQNFLNENLKISILNTVIYGYVEGEEVEEKLKEIGKSVSEKFTGRVKWYVDGETEVIIKFNEIDIDRISKFLKKHFPELIFEVEEFYPDIANTFFENYAEARQYVDEHGLNVSNPNAPQKIEEITDVNDIDAQIALLLKQKEALLKKQKPTE